MSQKSPCPKKGLAGGTVPKDGSPAAASALHAKTRVVKFRDFQSDSLLPDRSAKSASEDDSGSSDGSTR
jgi:hypothetical protein